MILIHWSNTFRVQNVLNASFTFLKVSSPLDNAIFNTIMTGATVTRRVTTSAASTSACPPTRGPGGATSPPTFPSFTTPDLMLEKRSFRIRPKNISLWSVVPFFCSLRSLVRLALSKNAKLNHFCKRKNATNHTLNLHCFKYLTLFYG